jgi:maltooligosyltrehalose trehalohydrolase
MRHPQHRHGPVVNADGTTTFRVWAPAVDRVDLLLAGTAPQRLAPGRDGWHELTTRAAHGEDYAFSLDGGEPRPDPAARWLPDGVHGRSRLYDPARFAWSEAERTWRAAPLAGAVIYELHIGTFTPEATLDGAIHRLAGLADLGVTHVEVMPVNAYNGDRGWGYDGVAWYATHEPYGGPEALARFVDACHRTGLAVILDVVYNHLGPSGNYLPEFGPYLTGSYATPWGAALNLDGPGSDPVRAYIVGNALQWLGDFHVDALRLDAVHGLIDTSAVHILAELADSVEQLSARLHRPLQLIAESDRCDPLTIRPREAGGTGMHGQWADDLHHAIHTAVTGERDGYYVDYDGLPDVARTYRRGFLFDGTRYSRHRGRTVGAPLGDIPGHRLVTCIQNHDQIGNRAAGERLTALVDPALVRAAAVMLCASPTTPMLFMGEEFGATTPFQYFTSHPEPELADAVRNGRREEFATFADFADHVPDPQDPATFTGSRLDWSEAETEAGTRRQALWRDLLALRRTHAALANGRRDLVELVAADRSWLALIRRDPVEQSVLLTVNLGATVRAEQVPRPQRGSWTLLLDSSDEAYGGEGGPGAVEPGIDDAAQTLAVSPHSAALWIGGPG